MSLDQLDGINFGSKSCIDLQAFMDDYQRTGGAPKKVNDSELMSMLGTPFLAPPISEIENERLKSLWSYQIFETDQDTSMFKRIVNLAKSHFKVPIVLISLVGTDTQWFPAESGLNAKSTGRDVSFCGHAILAHRDAVFIILNSDNDYRFKNNPLVTGPPFIKFYAGAPLSVGTTTNVRGESVNTNIGTICLIDSKPHSEFGEEDQESLKSYARMVVSELSNWRDRHLLVLENSLQKSMLECLYSSLLFPNLIDSIKAFIATLYNTLGVSYLLVTPNETEEFSSADKHILPYLAYGLDPGDWNESFSSSSITYETIKSKTGSLLIDNERELQKYKLPSSFCPEGGQRDSITICSATIYRKGEFFELANAANFNNQGLNAAATMQKSASHGSSPTVRGSIKENLQGRNSGSIIANFSSNSLFQPNFSSASSIDTASGSVNSDENDGEIYGTIIIISDKKEAPLTKFHQRFLQSISKSISGIIQRHDVMSMLEKQKALEQKQKEELLAVSERLSVSKRILFAVSHELRTPLYGIMGGVELYTCSNESCQKTMRSIDSCCNALILTVNNLIDSREFIFLPDNNSNPYAKVILVRESCEDILTGVLSSLNFQFEQKNISLLIRLKYPKVKLVVDSSRVKQVFYNILNNSIKFSDPNTKIVISDDMSTSDGNSTYTLMIKDEGCGFQASVLKHLGEEFLQGEKVFGGVGLGLALSIKIMKIWEGKVECSNNAAPDRGALVKLIFNKAVLENEIVLFDTNLGDNVKTTGNSTDIVTTRSLNASAADQAAFHVLGNSPPNSNNASSSVKSIVLHDDSREFYPGPVLSVSSLAAGSELSVLPFGNKSSQPQPHKPLKTNTVLASVTKKIIPSSSPLSKYATSGVNTTSNSSMSKDDELVHSSATSTSASINASLESGLLLDKGRHTSIAIIDDNNIVLQTIKRQLEKLGFDQLYCYDRMDTFIDQVIEKQQQIKKRYFTANGLPNEANAKAEEIFDVVFTDYSIPGIYDGASGSIQIKKLMPSCLIIMFSAMDVKLDEVPNAAKCFLPKPVTLVKVESTLLQYGIPIPSKKK